MKTIRKVICTTCMLALTLTAFAQQIIEDAFERIGKMTGIKASVSNFQNDTNEIPVSTTVTDILVDRQNFTIFDNLRDAFKKERGKAYMEWSCYEPIKENLPRRPFRILRGMGDDIIVGQEKNSSFTIMLFEDPENKECRTVYSAEWWDTEDPDIRQGRLVRSYGKKPNAQTNMTRTYRFSIPEGMSIDSLMARNGILSDSLMTKEWTFSMPQIDSITVGNTKPFGNFRHYHGLFNGDSFGSFPDDSFFFGGNNRDVLGGGDINRWENKAVSNIGKLNPSDWLRLFGLLTEKIDKVKNEDSRELIVSAGLVLDLCKNVPKKLDEDERLICSKRLMKIARSIEKTNEYVYDILVLAANKVDL